MFWQEEGTSSQRAKKKCLDVRRSKWLKRGGRTFRVEKGDVINKKGS